jgi:hypothetical protein
MIMHALVKHTCGVSKDLVVAEGQEVHFTAGAVRGVAATRLGSINQQQPPLLLLLLRRRRRLLLMLLLLLWLLLLLLLLLLWLLLLLLLWLLLVQVDPGLKQLYTVVPGPTHVALCRSNEQTIRDSITILPSPLLLLLLLLRQKVVCAVVLLLLLLLCFSMLLLLLLMQLLQLLGLHRSDLCASSCCLLPDAQCTVVVDGQVSTAAPVPNPAATVAAAAVAPGECFPNQLEGSSCPCCENHLIHRQQDKSLMQSHKQLPILGVEKEGSWHT